MPTSLLIQIGQIMFPLITIVSVDVYVGKQQNPQLHSINEANLNVFVPALVSYSLSQKSFVFEKYAILGLCGLILVLVTALIVMPIARLLRLDYKTIAPPMMFHNAAMLDCHSWHSHWVLMD